MELRQLRYFAKLAETLSFSEAAKAVFITQSTLSQQIKQLEQELDAPLFQRTGHGVTLTEAGAELLPAALRTLHEANMCIERMHDLKELLSGELSVGVTFTFSPILTETLLTFMKLHPGVKLNIYYKPMIELIEMLERREVDFVLAFKPSERHDDIETHVLFDNCLAAIVNEYHPLAQRQKIRLEDLEGYDMALPSKGLQARNAFDIILAKHLNNPRVRIELNEVNILLNLIRQTNMVTILSEATTHNAHGVKAIRIDMPDNEMMGCVHTRKNTYRKKSMIEFIRLLSESNAIRERIRYWG